MIGTAARFPLSNKLLISDSQVVSVKQRGNLGKPVALIVCIINIEKVWAVAGVRVMMIDGNGPLNHCQLQTFDIFKGKTINPVMLRQLGLKIPEVLGHAGMSLVLGHVHKFGGVFASGLPLFLMLHLGTDGFKMLLPEHLHLETGLWSA